jgi:hypothetical protein
VGSEHEAVRGARGEEDAFAGVSFAHRGGAALEKLHQGGVFAVQAELGGNRISPARSRIVNQLSTIVNS